MKRYAPGECFELEGTAGQSQTRSLTAWSSSAIIMLVYAVQDLTSTTPGNERNSVTNSVCVFVIVYRASWRSFGVHAAQGEQFPFERSSPADR